MKERKQLAVTVLIIMWVLYFILTVTTQILFEETLHFEDSMLKSIAISSPFAILIVEFTYKYKTIFNIQSDHE